MKRCTMCGNKLDTVDKHGNFSFQHRVGYGSKYDGDIVCLTFCCGCFDKVVDIISMMSKEKIVFTPQELPENYGSYLKRVKVRGRSDPSQITSDGRADRLKGFVRIKQDGFVPSVNRR